MVCIRKATMEDLLAMQRCNLLCLPENYQLKVRMLMFEQTTCICRIILAPIRHTRQALLTCCRHALAVLLLPHPVVAPAAVRRGGLQRQDRRLRARQDVSASSSKIFTIAACLVPSRHAPCMALTGVRLV